MCFILCVCFFYNLKFFMILPASRWNSRSLMSARLSRTFLPRHNAISNFTLFRSLKYAFSGTMLYTSYAYSIKRERNRAGDDNAEVEEERRTRRKKKRKCEHVVEKKKYRNRQDMEQPLLRVLCICILQHQFVLGHKHTHTT